MESQIDKDEQDIVVLKLKLASRLGNNALLVTYNI